MRANLAILLIVLIALILMHSPIAFGEDVRHNHNKDSRQPTKLTKVVGMLGQAGSCYVISREDGTRVWMLLSEDKLTIRQLDGMLNRKVVAEGELKRNSGNARYTALPPGVEYLDNGFTIELSYTRK